MALRRVRLPQATRSATQSKYHAVKTTIEGVTFASAREAARYQDLRLLERAGEIRQLVLQPRYGLYVTPFGTVARDLAEIVKCGDYVADFQYTTAAGATVVEDVKGVRTPVYRLKRKWVEALYGLTIREI